MKRYIENIIVPYVEKTKKDMKLPSCQRALCIMDNFSAQCTDALFESHGIDTVYVPANCTGELQPMNISVNKPVKTYLREEFQNWYAKEMLTQVDYTDTEQSDITSSQSRFQWEE